jgi:hypothetical protein
MIVFSLLENSEGGDHGTNDSFISFSLVVCFDQCLCNFGSMIFYEIFCVGVRQYWNSDGFIRIVGEFCYLVGYFIGNYIAVTGNTHKGYVFA